MRRKGIYVQDYSDYPVIVDDLFEFNKLYIQESIDLFTHKFAMDEKIYIAAQTALAEQYAAELQLKRAQAQSKTDEKFYLADGLTSELRIRAVRRRRSWENSPLKEILDKRIMAEAGGHVAELKEGLEPDVATEFFYFLLDEFIPRRKHRRFAKNHYNRIMKFLIDFSGDDTPDNLYELLLRELVPERRREKFKEQNGDYLKTLVQGFMLRYSEAGDLQGDAEAAETAQETPEEGGNEEEPMEESGDSDDDSDDSAENEFGDLAELEEDELADLAELEDAETTETNSGSA